MTIVGLAPVGVLFGFGVSFVGAGLFYGLPMAVQPMKAVSAVMLTGELSPGTVAASGLLIGAVFLILGVTGTIRYIARLIPKTLTAGLQLGLGLSMAFLGLRLLADTLWLGVLALLLLLASISTAGKPPNEINIKCLILLENMKVLLVEITLIARLA